MPLFRGACLIDGIRFVQWKCGEAEACAKEAQMKVCSAAAVRNAWTPPDEGPTSPFPSLIGIRHNHYHLSHHPLILLQRVLNMTRRYLFPALGVSFCSVILLVLVTISTLPLYPIAHVRFRTIFPSWGDCRSLPRLEHETFDRLAQIWHLGLLLHHLPSQRQNRRSVF